MSTSFSSFKADLTGYLTGALPGLGVDAPVVAFLPDDVSELPVFVVGRAGVTVHEGVMATYVVLVDLVGRRLADRDAQDELDTLADALLVALALLPPNMSLDAMDPTTQLIAGVEYPVQRATVIAHDRLPCP